MIDPVFDVLRDPSVPFPAPLQGRLIEAFIGPFVIQVFKPREDKPVKIPVHKAGVRNFEGVCNCKGCMGKLIYHAFRRLQIIVLAAGVFTRKPGDLAVQGYGP
jgi:hypothetical protein